MKNNYKFKGVFIPKKVWLDERLSPTQKFLLCEIDAMSDGKDEPCYASNTHFSKHLQISTGTVKNILTKLIKLGYLKRKYEDNDTNKKRFLWVDFETKQLDDGVSSENDGVSSENDGVSSENDTINKLLNKLEKEEEEERLKNPSKDTSIEELSQTEFINILRLDFPNIPIKIKNGQEYYFSSTGHLHACNTNKKISSAMALAIYERMYNVKTELYNYLFEKY